MGTTELNVVTGAFSYTGKYIAQRLLSMGKKVITLTSRSDRGNVFDHKVQVFPFNFDKPGELTDSLRGATTIYNTYWTCFHDLRHTFASLMLLAGVHVKVVSEMLGHSSVAFTLDVYSYVIPGLQEAAGKRLDEVLDPELRQKKNVGKSRWRGGETAKNEAGVGGFEPPTCGFGDRCSSQLSYTPLPSDYNIFSQIAQAQLTGKIRRKFNTL